MWMSSPLHTRPLFSFFLHDFSTSRPKRDLLLFVARHTTVTLTRNAPLFRAQSPGISVSRVEPSGGFVSWYSPSSSRSLGHSLLLGQRSRLNFFSHLVRSLFHQHHRGPHTQFMGHRHNGNSRTEMTRMFFRYGSKELQQLAILGFDSGSDFYDSTIFANWSTSRLAVSFACIRSLRRASNVASVAISLPK